MAVGGLNSFPYSSMLANNFHTDCLTDSDAGFQALLDESRNVLRETWPQEETIVANWLQHYDDSLYESQRHLWGVYDGTQIVATARITIHDDLNDVPAGYLAVGLENSFSAPIASLNRLAVRPSYQNLGIGHHLDEVRLSRARELGAGCAIVICRDDRLSMLRKIGFELLRSGIPGIEMPSIKWAVLRYVIRD